VVALAKLPKTLFSTKNAKLIIIGCSPPERVLSYASDTNFDPDNIYTDHCLGLFKALGLHRAKGFTEIKGKGEKAKESITSVAAGLAWSTYKTIKYKNGDFYQVN